MLVELRDARVPAGEPRAEDAEVEVAAVLEVAGRARADDRGAEVARAERRARAGAVRVEAPPQAVDVGLREPGEREERRRRVGPGDGVEARGRRVRGDEARRPPRQRLRRAAADEDRADDGGQQRGGEAEVGRGLGRAEREAWAGKECEIPNFGGSYLGRFPLVSADFWTSDHLSERSRT